MCAYQLQDYGRVRLLDLRFLLHSSKVKPDREIYEMYQADSAYIGLLIVLIN